MSKAASRLYHQATYGPLTAKTLQTILRQELMEQFGFEHMGLIADALIKRFLEILDRFSPDRIRLAPGQVLWLAVAKDARGGPNKTMMATRLVPVRLTLVAPEDLDQIANDRKIPRQLRPEVVARLLREAAAQDGVLSLSDLGVLLGVTSDTAGRAVHEYEQRHDVVLPYRGVLHDLGPTTSHKVQAIELKLRGMLTREIARRIHHDPRSVDIYQSDFERVYELHAEGKSPRQISFLIKRSVRLVREYIRIIEEYLEAVGPDQASTPPTKTQSKRPPQPQGKRKGTSS